MYLHGMVTIIDSFLHELDVKSQYSNHTIKAYRIDLYQTFKIARDEVEAKIEAENRKYGAYTLSFESKMEVRKLDETQLLKAIKLAQVKWVNMELSTRQRKSATLKSFLHWLYMQKLISTPLQEKIEAPSVPRKIPHFLSVDEVFQIFDHLQNKNKNSKNNKYYLSLVYLLYGGGLRVSEACQLQWKNIRPKSGDILILGKGNKERWVVLPQKAIDSITQLPQESESIWGTKGLSERKAYEWVKNLGKSAGLRTPLHPHALRHSYATHLVSAGMNLRTLQELMGHSSLASTEKYLHLSMDQLARTMESHHPLGDNLTQTVFKNK